MKNKKNRGPTLTYVAIPAQVKISPFIPKLWSVLAYDWFEALLIE